MSLAYIYIFAVVRAEASTTAMLLRINLEMVVSWIQFLVQLVKEKLSFGSGEYSFINTIFGAAIEEALSRPPLLCRAGLHMQTRSS